MNKLFMDSGAYSAKTKGPIDIEKYARFLIENSKYIEVSAGLDVIFDAEATWLNQQRIESLGVKGCIPTFHIGEDFKWLEKYANEYDYIGLGGTASKKYSVAQRHEWLQKCWSEYLTGPDGYPLVRVHGFAATSPDVMRRFPWYSVDSTSWLMSAASGKAVFCDFEYSRGRAHLFDIPISGKNPDAAKRDRHIESYTPAQRAAVDALIAKHGFEIEKLATDYKQRFLSNAKAYVDFASTVKYHSFNEYMSGDLFAGHNVKRVKRKPVPAWESLNFYLAGNPGPDHMTYDLMCLGYNILLSYFYVRESDKYWKQAVRRKDELEAQRKQSDDLHSQAK